MTRDHFLRALALSAVLATAALSATWGILFYRPLPTIDGHFRMLGLHERAEIVRDVFGTPYIHAADAHDLYFLQGYVTAQDRLAQMEQLRELARGDRPLPIERVSPSLGEALEAYTSGVNKLVAQYAEAKALPGELVLAGRRPAPWTASDPLAIAATFLVRRVDPSACAASLDPGRGPVLGADLYTDAAEPGWYTVGLETATDRAAGASLPGLPGIVAGHNGWLAWSIFSARDATAALEMTVGALEEQKPAGLAARFRSATVTGCLASIEGTVVTTDGPPANETAGRALGVERLRLLLGRPERKLGGVRIVVDLSDPASSRIALSSGQSAQRASPHYRDEAALWEVGQVRRLLLSRPPVGLTEGELILRAR